MSCSRPLLTALAALAILAGAHRACAQGEYASPANVGTRVQCTIEEARNVYLEARGERKLGHRAARKAVLESCNSRIDMTSCASARLFKMLAAGQPIEYIRKHCMQ